MPITRDPDFPAEIAQLVQSFNRCADGHEMTTVIEAAANMFSASIHNYAAARGMTREQAIGFARGACNGVMQNVEMNLGRKAQSTDVPVREQ